MHPNLQILFRKSVYRSPFGRISRPLSSFYPKILTPISKRCISDPLPAPKLINFTPLNQKFHYNLHSMGITPSSKLNNHDGSRKFSSESPADFDLSKEIDFINLKFAVAREEIEMASESKDTIYFDEELQNAQKAVKVVLDKFQALLEKLPESERASLQRSMGLKIEQLKAELAQLDY